jgi:hypothetical protein
LLLVDDNEWTSDSYDIVVTVSVFGVTWCAAGVDEEVEPVEFGGVYASRRVLSETSAASQICSIVAAQ